MTEYLVAPAKTKQDVPTLALRPGREDETVRTGNPEETVVRRQVACYNEIMAKMIEQIRRALEASGKTRYRISQESGISQGQLSRLVSGERGLTVDTLERLAECLGLEITIRPKRRKKG